MEQVVTIPAPGTLQAGITWSSTVLVGEVIYINDFEITKLEATTPEYQYYLKDHLGNVRVTFTTIPSVDQQTGTYELVNATTERANFVRYDNARTVNAAIFDHTNDPAPHSPAYSYSERLSASANEKYGLARSISVMPGDVVQAEVYAKYVDTNSGNWTNSLATLMGQIASNTAGVVYDGVSYSSSTSSFPSAFTGLVTKTDDGAPKAYLNWLVFDRNYTFLTGGFKQITTICKETGTDVAHEYLSSGNFTITQPGYVYIYLSNESASPVEVYFDDFKVTQTKSPVIQQQDFYPFGLPFNSYSRENTVSQNYQYNGKENMNDLGLNWDDYGARMYDPALGRWFVPDLLAELAFNLTPYRYCYNNPVNYTDPFGLWEQDTRGNWSSSDPDDISRFLLYMQTENGALNNTPTIQQIDTFIKGEQSEQGMGTLSDGSVLVSEVTVNGYLDKYKIGELSFSYVHWVTDKESFDKAWHEVQRFLTPDGLDPRTLNQNIFNLTYPGPWNPKTYSGQDDYSYVPKNPVEMPGYIHDKEYDRLNIRGASGLLTDKRAIKADLQFVLRELNLANDPRLSVVLRAKAWALGNGLYALALPKIILSLLEKLPEPNYD